MFKTLITAFLFLLLQVTSLFAQPYIMNHFTVKDGLPSNAIRSMNEDAQGNLWIVTDNGVVKYNGSTFKTYNSFDNLKIGSVFYIFPSSDGRVYLIDYVKNLDYIYNDKLYTINTGDVSFRGLFDMNGTVYGTDRVGNAFYVKGDSLIDILASVPKPILEKLFQKDSMIVFGNLMAAYPYIVRIDGRKFTAIHIKTGKMVTATYTEIPEGYRAIFRSKVYFTQFDKGVLCYDPAKNKFYEKRFNDSTNIAYVIKQMPLYNSREMQFTTNNGFLALDEWLNVVDSLRMNVKQEGITSIFQDKARNLWLLTNSGLKFLSSYFKKMQFFPQSKNKNIAYFNNELYIVHHDGNVFVYDTMMRKKREIKVEDAFRSSFSPVFYSVLERADSLLIATNKNITIIKKDGSNYSVKAGTSKAQMLMTIKDIIYDKDTLLVVLYEGLFKISVSGTIEQYNNIGRFNKIITGANDSIFVGDNNSIYFVNKGVAVPYSNRLTDTIKKVTNFNVPDFLVSEESHWIAAINNHIFTWNMFTGQLNRFYVNSKVSFLKAEKNNLWISTSYMLYRFVKNNVGEYVLHSKYYNFGYGLYQNIIDITSTASSFFLSTDHGIVKVSMSDVHTDKDEDLHVPVITKIIYGKYTFYNTNDTANKFDYTPSNLSINFSVNTVGYDNDVTYHYYLEGVDGQWQTSSSDVLTYSTLKPGTYKLHFKVSLDKYDLHGKEQVVKITIVPLWWQSAVLRVILALIIAGILGLILVKLSLRRKNQMLRKALMEKNISSVKLSALQSQMNPHFIFNAMASIQSFVKQKRNDIAEESLTEFATLIRLYLEFSRKQLISLEEELSTLRLYTSIEMKRFDNKFDVVFDINTELTYTEILLPPLIIQPYVENAISHGLYHKLNGRGRLDVVITEKAGKVEVIVEDNGIGRDKANSINEGMKRGTSRGLQLINERIKILNETGMIDVSIDITDKADKAGQPEGTRVTIHFKTNTHYDQGTNR